MYLEKFLTYVYDLIKVDHHLKYLWKNDQNF